MSCGSESREREASRLPRLVGLFVSGILLATMSVVGQRGEDGIESLLAQMTLEEKFGQLQQLDGLADGRYRPEHVELVRHGLLGSTLNVRGVANVNALQR